jgi:hypothetical protein
MTRALDQWVQNPEFRLWYNSNHVISLEPEFEGHDLSIMKSYPCMEYIELGEYGYEHLVKAFSLNGKYSKVLEDYLSAQ